MGRVMETNTVTWLALATISLLASVEGKVFSRCEFARELLNKQGFARATLGHWVCLANYESSYNTGATNDNTNGSRDYGIFQIIWQRHGFNAWYGWINHCEGTDVETWVTD